MAGMNKSVSFRIIADAGTAQKTLEDITAQADELKKPVDLNFIADPAQVNSLSESMKGLGDTTKGVTESLKATADATKGMTDTEEAAKGVTASFGDSLKGLGDTAALVADIEKGIAESNAVLAKSMDASNRATLSLARTDKILADAENGAIAKAAELAAAQDKASVSTDKQSAAGLGLGSHMGMAAIGIGVVSAASVKMAGDFQQSTNKLVTSAGETTQNIGMIRAGMLKLSVQTATTTQELSSGMYMVESAGFHGAQGLTVLKAAAEGARAEQAPLAEVTNAVTSALKSYHLGANSATMITNQMVASVGHGKMTFADFAGSLSTVLPIASAAGLSFAQVGGAIATLTNHGTSADEATLELANSIRNLQKPNNVAVQEMQRLGLSSVDVMTNLGKRGLTGTIEMLQEAILSKMGPAGTVLLSSLNETKQASQDAQMMLAQMPPKIQKMAEAYSNGTISIGDWRTELKAQSGPIANVMGQYATLINKTHGFSAELKAGGPAVQTYNAAMAKMMGGATGLNTALMLGGENMSTFRDNVKAVGDAGKKTGQDVNGWSDIQSTFNFKMDKTKVSVKDAAIAFGTALLPAVTALIEPIAKFAGWIASSSAASRTFAVLVGGLLSVVLGTKLVQGFMAARTAGETLFAGLSKLPALLGLQTVATEGATEAQTGLNIAMSASVIGVIIIAIGALILIFAELWKHSAAFRDFWKDAWRDIKGAAVAAWHFIDHDMIQPLMSGIHALVSWIEGHWKLLATILGTVLLGPIGGLIVFVATHWSAFVRLTSQLVSDVVGFFRSLGNDIINIFSNAGQWLYNAGYNIVMGLWNGFVNLADKFLNMVANFGQSVINKLGSIWKIFSPSHVTKFHGEMLVEGVIQGILGSTPRALAAVNGFGNLVTGAMSSAIGRGANVGLHGTMAGGQAVQQVNNFNITGMVTDPNGIARQIAQLLNDYNRENGKELVFA